MFPFSMRKFSAVLTTCLLSFACHAQYRLELAQLQNISPTSQFVIKGENPNARDAILVLRADDTDSPGYADRANLERVLPPGKFELTVPMASLRTPAGKKLNLEALKQVIIFSGRDETPLTIENVAIVTPQPLGENVLALDFGAPDSAVWPGFTGVDPSSALLEGENLQAIDRGNRQQAADPLMIDGIRGIEKLTLPLTKGEWLITLFFHDPGEWEYLPHPLQRKIFIDDKEIYSKKMSSTEWISNVYLQNRRDLTPKEATSWQQVGQKAASQISAQISSSGAPVVVTLRGDTLDSQFLNAVMVTPANNKQILETFFAEREKWWNNNWPTAAWQPKRSEKSTLQVKSEQQLAAPGTSALFEFEFAQGKAFGAPMVVVKKFQSKNDNKQPFNYAWHWGQWHLSRTSLSSTLLVARNDLLRFAPLPNQNELANARRLTLRVDIAQDAKPDDYQGELQIVLPGGQTLSVPFKLSVLDVELPKLTKPVGVYLEKQVQFGWFDELARTADEALLCDLNYLKKLGLTGISPPFPTPDSEKNEQAFEQLFDEVTDLGYFTPLAYAPAKRLLAVKGASGAAQIIANIQNRYAKRLRSGPVWSIADEPSNPGHADEFAKLSNAMAVIAPKVKVAGHLNSVADHNLLDLFDLVLINDGFGVDLSDIRSVKQKVEQVWLYNLDNVRAATGFYLWRVGADGFLKWHGRMPTADPFDPTDGREADAQLLYPSAAACPAEPDIDYQLYQLMQGIVDHRWLMWLEKQQNDPKAVALLEKLQSTLPTQWQKMQELDDEKLDELRLQIMSLAR
ncbi:MAG: hypothetical protein ACRC24_00110 [Vibrionaceae bacterium]